MSEGVLKKRHENYVESLLKLASKLLSLLDAGVSEEDAIWKIASLSQTQLSTSVLLSLNSTFLSGLSWLLSAKACLGVPLEDADDGRLARLALRRGETTKVSLRLTTPNGIARDGDTDGDRDTDGAHSSFAQSDGCCPTSLSLFAAAQILVLWKSSTTPLSPKSREYINSSLSSIHHVIKIQHLRKLPTSGSWFMSQTNNPDLFGSQFPDLRFTYCGLLSLILSANRDTVAAGDTTTKAVVCSLSLSRRLLIEILSADQRRDLHAFAISCQNSDGGFGSHPNAPSHAGHTYCGVGVISLLAAETETAKETETETETAKETEMNERSSETTETQLLMGRVRHFIASLHDVPTGGFRGRLGKPVDCCYSFWCLAAFANSGGYIWEIPGADKMVSAILSCACSDSAGGGGFSKHPRGRPDNWFSMGAIGDRDGDGNRTGDPFHTCFALLALSILIHSPQSALGEENRRTYLAHLERSEEDQDRCCLSSFLLGLAPIDPIFALPDFMISSHLGVASLSHS